MPYHGLPWETPPYDYILAELEFLSQPIQVVFVDRVSPSEAALRIDRTVVGQPTVELNPKWRPYVEEAGFDIVDAARRPADTPHPRGQLAHMRGPVVAFGAFVLGVALGGSAAALALNVWAA